MWRPDRSVRGPERPAARDIDPLNRVFAESFTDRYSRDGLVGVRVPQLTHQVWRYALEDAGDGAMVWRDAEGHMVAFNMVHRSGTEGWMGPLAVRPDRQGEGIGSMMVLHGLEWLREEGATTIGLETMPRTVDNIGFYSRLRLVPGAPDRHPRPRRSAPQRGASRASVRRRRPLRRAHRRMQASDRCAPAGRGLHAGDQTHPRSPDRRYHDGARRTRPRRVRTLALGAARGRAPEGRASGAQARRPHPRRRSTVCSTPSRGARRGTGWSGSRSGVKASSPAPICGWWDWGIGCTGRIFGCCWMATRSDRRCRGSSCRIGRFDALERIAIHRQRLRHGMSESESRFEVGATACPEAGSQGGVFQ